MQLSKPISQMLSAILIALWVFAAVSKLADMTQARSEMLGQVFPRAVALALVWIVPLTELLLVWLLLFESTRYWGLVLSAILLSLFSAYILAILANAFDFIPCSCAGISKIFGWRTHLLFNICMLLIAFAGIRYQNFKPGEAENL